MNILIIPKIKEPYLNQIEFSVEKNLLIFLKKCFKNCSIDVTYNYEIKKKYNLIILSGGNTIPKFSKDKKDKLRNKLDVYFFKNANLDQIPIIGICHGGQFIATKYKLDLVKDTNHVGSHEIINLSNIKIKFNFIKSFHNFKIKFKNTKYIQNLVLAKDNSIECFRIKNKKIGAIIWHPERENTKVLEQIKFFRTFYSIIK
tara:strand:+ start:75 stop:677 length:603 start_codon:yes stop_codon:yes gene_type:complete